MKGSEFRSSVFIKNVSGSGGRGGGLCLTRTFSVSILPALKMLVSISLMARQVSIFFSGCLDLPANIFICGNIVLVQNDQ